MRSYRSLVALGLGSLVLIVSCSSSTRQAATTQPARVTTPPTATEAAPETTTTAPLPKATFTVRAGTNQLAVLDATPGTDLELVDTGGAVTKGIVDDQGSFLWRQLDEGDYSVRTVSAKATQSASAHVSKESDIPAQSFYAAQKLPAGGYTYITTRDGTTLSATVSLPGPADGGPYPTVVEYSGYSPSDPDNKTFAQLFNALGYGYVGVNMRGSGCSGGSYQFFERAQSLDGYDMIEAIAAQPWVLNNKVGMVGISYPGISQLFVASTQPPSLEAITPLSVLDDSYRATGYPGGILNTGFAAQFAQERFNEAKPYGQKWTKKRADEGDKVCADNQKLRLQNPDFLALTRASEFYDPKTADVLSPSTFVDKITVPTFLAGAWQDEQTGGHFADMLNKFTGTKHLYVDLVNGLHTESLSPTIFARMVEFLDLYVGRRTPSLAGARIVAPILIPGIWGDVGTIALPADRFTGMTYAESLKKFESEKPVRVLFEEGAADGSVPSAPLPRWIESFAAWPVPETVATSWYLGESGELVSDKPTVADSSESYVANPTALPAAFYPGGRSSDIWKAGTVYDWQSIPDGDGLGFATAPLEKDTVLVGGGSADLWVKATTASTDLEVTISEVRPDGSEMYVQSGWLRTSHRTLDETKSTDLLPVQTHLAADKTDLAKDGFTAVRIELFPFSYAFRAGSRLRITIDAPGDSRPVWAFETPNNKESVTIAHDSTHPSKIVLSLIPDLKVPAGVAACGTLRGQPCRTYQPIGSESRAD